MGSQSQYYDCYRSWLRARMILLANWKIALSPITGRMDLCLKRRSQWKRNLQHRPRTVVRRYIARNVILPRQNTTRGAFIVDEDLVERWPLARKKMVQGINGAGFEYGTTKSNSNQFTRQNKCRK